MPNPKVKDMPRKQQMAVKATMADGGKGNPNKMKQSPALRNLKFILAHTLICGLQDSKAKESVKRF